MSETTVNLEMPYILPSQAQKHVTHNEALQKLDAAVQLTFTAIAAAPPSAPAEGACFAILPAATGEWAGRDGRIAMRQDGAWLYLNPREGWRAWDAQGGRLLVHEDGAWHPLPLPAEMSCETLGVSATADAGNRLAVSSPASLFNHAGNGHQIKVNKAQAADTASLLFQSNWTGFAEMGLAGNNEFSVKVSDGSNWRNALLVSQQGLVRRPLNPAFTAWQAAGSASPASGSQSGFDEILNFQGTAALGATLAQGRALTVPATGLYLLSLRLIVLSSTGFEITLTANGVVTLSQCRGGNSGAVAATLTVTALAALTAGDALALSHTGAVTLEHGAGRTGLTGFML